MAEEISLWDLYQWNSEFKGYVDRYAKHYHIRVEEALRHELVRQMAKALLEGDK